MSNYPYSHLNSDYAPHFQYTAWQNVSLQILFSVYLTVLNVIRKNIHYLSSETQKVA